MTTDNRQQTTEERLKLNAPGKTSSTSAVSFQLSVVKSSKGITLLEIMLAIGMLSIVAVILFPIFAGFLRQAELNDTSKQLLSVLGRAQQFSQSQEGNDSWVVALWNVTSTDYFELYPSSTPTSKETFFFPPNIVFTDDTVPTSTPLYIKFEKFTGRGWYATSSDFINESKTFNLSLKNNPESKVTIEVGKEGRIAVVPSLAVDLKINDTNGPVAVLTTEQFNITWATEECEAASCTCQGLGDDAAWLGAKSVPSGGPETRGPLISQGSYVYILECSDGERTASDSVTVNANPPPPIVDLNSFEDGNGDDVVDITTVNTFTLTWSSSYADYCEATSVPVDGNWDNPNKATSGNQTLGPLAQGDGYQYILECFNNKGSASDTVTVNVTPCINTAPVVPTLSSPGNGASGVSTNPTVSWNSISSWGTNCAGNNNTYTVFLDTNNPPTTNRGTVGQGTNSLNIAGLNMGTTYFWKVRASNGALYSDSLVWSFTTVSVSVTYDIPLANLLSQPSSCAVNSYYNNCSSANLPGFWWNDTRSGSVSNVTIEINIGVQCHTAGTTRNITLNGTNIGSFSAVYWCNCNARNNIHALVVPGVALSKYVVGGYNEIRILSPTTCEGQSINTGWPANTYARVTVTY